jgi:hypothetical protein
VNKDNSKTIKVGVKYWKSMQIKIIFNIKKLFKDGGITQPEWKQPCGNALYHENM